MLNQDTSKINFILYKEDTPIGEFRSDYVGLLGLHVKGNNKLFKKNIPFELEVKSSTLPPQYNHRIPVVVSSTSDNGIGFRLKNYDIDLIERWKSILSESFSTTEVNSNAVSMS